jgi:hypothetical protein
VAFCGELPAEPVPPGSRFIDKDEMLGLSVELPDEVIDVTVTGADGAQRDDLGVVIVGTIGHRHSIFRPIEPHREWARLAHG